MSAAAAIFGNVLSSVVGGLFGSSSVDKQNEAQRQENELNRQHNLQLAQYQNQENLKQWNRENAYNSPAAQMQRYQAAGLNPNLIYGQTNTAPQLSGSLTSGAPSSPTQLVGKSGLMERLFGSLGDSLMNLPMYREEVNAAKLANEEKRLDIAAKQHEKDIRDWLSSIFTIDEPMSAADFTDMAGGMINHNQLRALNELRMQSEELKDKQGANRLFDKNFDSIVREVTANSDLKRAEAEYLLRTLQGRIDATNEDNKIKTVEDFEGWFQLLVRFSRVIADSIGRVIK